MNLSLYIFQNSNYYYKITSNKITYLGCPDLSVPNQHLDAVHSSDIPR